MSQLPEYPADHLVGMRVPKGGSDCAKCRFVSEDHLRCGNTLFRAWNDGDELPAPADEYCCDFFEPIKEEPPKKAGLETNEQPANPDTARDFAPRGPDPTQQVQPGYDEIIPPHSQIGDPRARGAVTDVLSRIGRPGDRIFFTEYTYKDGAWGVDVADCDVMVVALHPDLGVVSQQLEACLRHARLVLAWWVPPRADLYTLNNHTAGYPEVTGMAKNYARSVFARASLIAPSIVVSVDRPPISCIVMRGAIPPTMQPDLNDGPGAKWNNPTPGEEDQVSPEPFVHNDFDQRWPEDPPPMPADDPIFNLGPQTLEVSSPNDQEPLNLDPITDNQGMRPHDRFNEDGGALPGGSPGGKGRPLDLPSQRVMFPPFRPDDPETPGIDPGKPSGELP